MCHIFFSFFGSDHSKYRMIKLRAEVLLPLLFGWLFGQIPPIHGGRLRLLLPNIMPGQGDREKNRSIEFYLKNWLPIISYKNTIFKAIFGNIRFVWLTLSMTMYTLRTYHFWIFSTCSFQLMFPTKQANGFLILISTFQKFIDYHFPWVKSRNYKPLKITF